MSRVEENRNLINKLGTSAEESQSGTYEQMTVFNIGVIASLLTDISKSLAVIADKVESEE